MSSARKRRTEIQSNTPPPGTPKLTPAFPSSSSAAATQRAIAGANNSNGSLMSLQQIINITDKRLTALEMIVGSGNNNNTDRSVENKIMNDKNVVVNKFENQVEMVTSSIKDSLEEVFHRMDLLVGEISELKDTLLKLQKYTIEVNHVLIQDKIKTGEIDNNVIPEIIKNAEEKDIVEQEEVTVTEPIVVTTHPSRRSRASKSS